MATNNNANNNKMKRGISLARKHSITNAFFDGVASMNYEIRDYMKLFDVTMGQAWQNMNEKYLESIKHTVHVSILTSTQFKDKNDKTYWKEIPYRINTFNVRNLNNLDKKINKRVQSFIDDKVNAESSIIDINVKSTQHNTYSRDPSGIDIKNIKMREASSLMIDGYPEQTWGTQTNRCVEDYLIYTYGKMKGCISICKNYESIEKALHDFDPKHVRQPIKRGSRDDDDYDGVINQYKNGHGMTAYHIAHIAEKIRVHMYMIDIDDTAIWHWSPSKLNKNLTPICFKMMNGHFYNHPNPKVMNGLFSSNYIEYKRSTKKGIVRPKRPSGRNG
jgi:hypothetical protein